MRGEKGKETSPAIKPCFPAALASPAAQGQAGLAVSSAGSTLRSMAMPNSDSGMHGTASPRHRANHSLWAPLLCLDAQGSPPSSGEEVKLCWLKQRLASSKHRTPDWIGWKGP